MSLLQHGIPLQSLQKQSEIMEKEPLNKPPTGPVSRLAFNFFPFLDL